MLWLCTNIQISYKAIYFPNIYNNGFPVPVMKRIIYRVSKSQVQLTIYFTKALRKSAVLMSHLKRWGRNPYKNPKSWAYDLYKNLSLWSFEKSELMIYIKIWAYEPLKCWAYGIDPKAQLLGSKQELFYVKFMMSKAFQNLHNLLDKFL